VDVKRIFQDRLLHTALTFCRTGRNCFHGGSPVGKYSTSKMVKHFIDDSQYDLFTLPCLCVEAHWPFGGIDHV
jgi:hypothetical protein